MCATMMRSEPAMTFSAIPGSMSDMDIRSVADRAERLLRLTSALTSATTVADVAQVSLGIGLHVVDAARGVMACLDAGNRKVHITSAGYEPAAEREIAGTRLTDDTPLMQCLRTG